MAEFVSIKQKTVVNETMADLLCPLKNHSDDMTKRCIEITLRILSETEIEKDKSRNCANCGKPIPEDELYCENCKKIDDLMWRG